MRQEIVVLTAALLAVASARMSSQAPAGETAQDTFTERGNVTVSGREVPYLIHRLPVSSFPQLPQAIAGQLEDLGCMIPQTFEAHRPENVIHASLERSGTTDWAVLCSTEGIVKLMVFFQSAPMSPTVLAAAPETERMEAHDSSGVFGFAWGIDPASPRRVREAQTGRERTALLDHDSVADTFVEKSTVYHFFTKNGWKVVGAGD
jgi:hypothetical protein